MIKSRDLKQIITSSVLIAAVGSVVLTLFVYGLFAFFDETLFLEELNNKLNLKIQQYANTDGVVSEKSDNDMFYRVEKTQLSVLPKYLKQAGEGFHDMSFPGGAYDIIVKEDERYRYILEILVDEHDGPVQEALENVDPIIYIAMIIGIVLSWLMAIFVAHRLTFKVLDPVHRLARDITRVREGDDSHLPLAQHYDNDEVGVLAKTFDEYNHKIYQFLYRERLFTSDISHELRTPLMVISSTCDMQLATIKKSNPVCEALATIKSSSNEIRGLVSIFLALARDDSAEMAEQTLASVNEILLEQIDQFKREAKEKGLLFHFCCIDEPVGLFSKLLLSVVAGNLIRNALYYTNSGEVTVETNRYGFSVIDTGSGIPKHIQHDIFQPFVRGADEPVTGAGMGLSIVTRICEKQGWDINIDSKLNVGSRFTIQLISNHV